ncbi:MAG TPA: low molecular weight protein-tyrosine-phosphatase [Steroidobacteraceae bacterium]|nr:low molecular weight protein-tyrosine-phosphatase [Steroidobacteraceae bacterium]
MIRILFVCLGNICRSPTAEAVLRGLAASEAPELGLIVDSCGTANYHPGSPPDRRSQAVARKRGYDLSDLRARQLRDGDFASFDLILAMDRSNLQELRERAPPGVRDRIQLFLDYAPEQPLREVPDPYYGGPGGFEAVLELIEAASRGLLRRLRHTGAAIQKA